MDGEILFWKWFTTQWLLIFVLLPYRGMAVRVYKTRPTACQHFWLIKAFLSGFLSEILVVRDTDGGGVYQQMLPTDLRKHGVGARCSHNLPTLGPADVAMTEMGTGRRNWSTGIKGSRISHFFCVGLYTPNWAILEGRERWRMDGEKYVNTEAKETEAEGGSAGQWCWRLSQMLSSAQNSARSHHVKAKLAEWTRRTPGPATSHRAQNSTAVSWTNADAKIMIIMPTYSFCLEVNNPPWPHPGHTML